MSRPCYLDVDWLKLIQSGEHINIYTLERDEEEATPRHCCYYRYLTLTLLFDGIIPCLSSLLRLLWNEDDSLKICLILVTKPKTTTIVFTLRVTTTFYKYSSLNIDVEVNLEYYSNYSPDYRCLSCILGPRVIHLLRANPR